MRTSMLLAVAVSAVACTPYDPDLGQVPFYCGTDEPKCPDGYACKGMVNNMPVCTNSTGSGSGGGTCTMPFTGVLATWNLAAEPGTQTSTAAMSSAAGVMASSISRAPSLMASAGTGSISASNWSTSTLDNSKYFTISLGAPTGCAIDLTAMAIDAKASTTGPASGAVSTSQDSFASNAAISTAMPTMLSLAISGATGTLEVRIYGYSATAIGGTLRVQNTLTVTGALK